MSCSTASLVDAYVYVYIDFRSTLDQLDRLRLLLRFSSAYGIHEGIKAEQCSLMALVSGTLSKPLHRAMKQP